MIIANQNQCALSSVPRTPSVVRFDFETRSRLDLKKVGSWVYSKHPSTEVLVLKFAVDDGPMQTFTPDMFNGCKCPELWARLVSSPSVIFEAFGAFFEWVIYFNNLVARYGWPPISPERWRCAMAASRHLALPGFLEGVGSALGLPVQKDKEGSRIMLKLSKPRKASKNNKDWFHSKASDFVKLDSYCATDVETHRGVSEAIGMLPLEELIIWQVDQMINRRGVHCDVETIEGAIHILDIIMGQYQDQIAELTLDKTTGISAVTKVTQGARIIEWCTTQGVHLDNLQAATVDDVLVNGTEVWTLAPDGSCHYCQVPLPPLVKAVLTIRKSANKSSVAKYEAMLNRVDRTDNRIRSILTYHGAATGRWSGSGIQIQNYPRGTFKFRSEKNPTAPLLSDALALVACRDFDGLRAMGDIPEILSTLLRSMLCAAPGKKLVAADYSQIEARILLWLVGDPGLAIFTTGCCVYKDLATTIYQVPLAEITDSQRWVGKQGILGLGYNMGWKRFRDQCAASGVTISDDMAKKVVSTYRKKYHRVKDYWDSVNSAAILAVQTGQPVRHGKVTFFMSGDFLKCRLPSGRDISYYQPHFVPSRFDPDELALAYWGMDSQKHQWCEIGLYGGKITENIVQAIAGCVLRVATVALEANQYPLVLSVHDELVGETPDHPSYSVERMIQLMCILPAWGQGIPLAAKGWEGQKFKK